MLSVVAGGVIVGSTLALLYVAFRWWGAKRLAYPDLKTGLHYTVSGLAGMGGVIGVVLGAYLDDQVSAVIPMWGGRGALAGLAIALLIALFHPNRRLPSRHPLGWIILIRWSFILMPILTIVGMAFGVAAT
jgi:hypothetical protein